ncbi:IS200/IS605 family transposase [Acetohalobium arabaticum]|uniref:Transposase IS200-family protein n=1 Tax=Acetohalobium arabaticum (strain ATCC 49924 / DSM 5501 / Z-7288) TaxID=574087 RepID=D9QUR5_ACEAZ|nr:IS200/IS605 family transposase [Acetohalobium arabaticum]ADL11974.1 transposase IS200-family protein [Acetohalobium arabaticum DSM 5501]
MSNQNNLIHARTCVYNVGYHIVFTVKCRKKVLTGKVATRLKEVLHQVAQDKEFIIETMELMPDYVDLFVTAHPKIAPSYIVKMSKGISGRLLLKEFPKLKEELYKGHLWNKSYYLETVGSISKDTVKQYIENQKSK